jgi:Putative zinc-finger
MSEEMKDALQGLAHRGLDAHPDPERLAAYHFGELSPEEEGRIQDHLALCRECAALLLDLDGLADPDFGAGVDLTGKEAVWQSLKEEVAPPAWVVPLRRPVRSSPRWLQALAASLLIATLGLSLWVASLRRELSTLDANAPVLDLYSGTGRGEGSPSPILTVPSGGRSFILIPNSARHRRHERYRFEILRGRGGKVWDGPIERNPPPLDNFNSVSVPRRAIEPGDYRFRLFGRNGDREEMIEEYAFRVP